MKKRVYKIVISFLMTALLFAGLLIFEKSKRPEIIMETAVVAKEDIPEELCLTEENMERYLMEKSVPKELCCGDYLTDRKQLLGKKAKAVFRKGTVLQKGWFLDRKLAEEQLENPVRVSVRTEDLSTVLGGSLREGDFADFFFVNKDTAQASLVFSGVFIESAYDSSGKIIARGDRDRAASMLTILLEESDVEKLCELLAGGTFRIAKTEDRSTAYERLEEKVNVQTSEEADS